ncbi:MAG: phage tail sheath C-terminal domain-containing protein [Acidobacteriota bacterium]
MPTYRAPGVFVEEISSGSRPITPVGTSTAAFIGVARKGPVNQATLVTNFAQFEKTFGGPYRVTGTAKHYLAYAVRHFFEQGGSRCYVVRVAHYNDPNLASSLQATAASQDFAGSAPNGNAVTPALSVQAISPGEWGRELTVDVIPSSGFSVRLGAAIAASATATQMSLASNDQVQVGSLLWIVEEVIGTIDSITAAGAITFNSLNKLKTGGALFGGSIANNLTVFGPGMAYVGKTSVGAAVPVVAGVPNPVDGIVVTPVTRIDGSPLRAGDTITIALSEARIVVERVGVQAGSPALTIAFFKGQALTAFPVNGSRVYSRDFTLRVRQDTLVLETHENLSLVNTNLADHVDTRLGPSSGASQFVVAKDESGSSDATFLNSSSEALQGGNDGLVNGAGVLVLNDADFTGSELLKTGLNALTPVRDAAILAIPNASETVTKAAIGYGDRRGDLFLILEGPAGNDTAEIQTYRNKLSSKYAAIYHPWIKIGDPFTGQPLLVPPCGAVAGIYALTDARRGVHKAPAGLDTGKVVVATGLELKVTKGEYDGLYPVQINAILSLRDGFHVWGSRTISADPEWLQVSIRRLFNFLEKSIENGTQWVTFEPNDSTLWKSIERNISAFLRVQWLEGKLVGASEKEAFFVHCNAETNPPEVVDAGQVVTLIGVAPSRPAEFVIFRIRQKAGQTAG